LFHLLYGVIRFLTKFCILYFSFISKVASATDLFETKTLMFGKQKITVAITKAAFSCICTKMRYKTLILRLLYNVTFRMG